jgi:hypothetical protein
VDYEEKLAAALKEGCAFAAVRVLSVTVEKAGTRSQTVAYGIEIVRPIKGTLPNGVLKQFGAPSLEENQLHIIGACDSHRHSRAWELRFAVLVGDLEAAVRNLVSKLAAQGGLTRPE